MQHVDSRHLVPVLPAAGDARACGLSAALLLISVITDSGAAP